MVMIIIRHKEVRYTLPYPPHYSTCTLNNVIHHFTSSLSSDTSQKGIVSTNSEEIPMRVVKGSPTGTSCQWR